MLRRIALLWTGLVVRYPALVTLGLLAVGAVALLLASQLTLDTNQLDLLDADMRAVTDAKQIIDATGGAGFLTLALRGSDTDRLKKVADEIANDLDADPRIRRASSQLPVGFLRARAAMYMDTADLEEVRRRVMVKVRDALKRASPFFFEIKKTEPAKLDLEDIAAKYRRVGKEDVEDDYFVSADGKMVLVRIKPMWDSNELAKTKGLVDELRDRLSENKVANTSLSESYDPAVPTSSQAVQFGFSGTYQSNVEDSYGMQESLVPVGGLAFIGVLLTLCFFFRRQLGVVALIGSGLVLGVILTFGFAKIAVGGLNMITSVLAGILMGIGIDFGIHLAYRLIYEAKQQPDLQKAVEETILHSGPASLASALGIGSAFASLSFSEFRGFSEFGILAGAGVLLVGGTLYLWVPSLLLWADRVKPGLGLKLVGAAREEKEHDADARLPRPGLWVMIAGGLAVAISVFAGKVAFEYNSRALMIDGQPSVVLQDEIKDRFDVYGDPLVVFLPDLDSARRFHSAFHPLDKKRYPSIDQVVTPFTFVPPKERQQRNAKVLAAWRAEIADLDLDKLPEEYRGRLDEALAHLNTKPFALSDLPPKLSELITSLPSARVENQGYLGYIYPGVDLWDGRMLFQFTGEVETIETPEQTFHASGLPILFVTLAKIVLADGRSSVLLTAILLALILLVDLRSLRDTALALVPLVLGLTVLLGAMAIVDVRLNFMNVIVFPILLGYGLSHGVYLLHRFREGVSPVEALRSVGVAVACSTITSIAGWAALLAASHKGLQSMGVVACLGMTATLLVSFLVMMPLLQLAHDRRLKKEKA